LIDVYSGLAAAGRAIPGGSCPTVGIAGLTLGGGVGVLTRQYGLTIDHLVSAQVVTPDSVLRTASAASHPDLFWALRGGGGGNFGVTTSFSFATVPAPDLVVFAVSFPDAPASAVLGGWQDWIQAAPAPLWANCIVSAGSSPSARVNGSFLGAQAGLTPVLDDLARRVGTGSGTRSVAAKGFLDAMLYFAGCPGGLQACHLPAEGGTLGREAFVASSRMMDRAVADPAAVTALVTGRSGIDLVFDSLGGAVARVGTADTAYAHRSSLATIQIYAGTNAAGQAAATQAVGEIRDALAPLAGSGAYVNYLDPALPGWPSAYYGGNLPRLEQVAATYDPHGVLAFPQGIGAARSGPPVGG
ncbi:MAG TPA: BBE domain-containing protein, partial [Actinomycetota bacterium]|nr:BBE domain-containing protein [Actinomycetota bacterium]